jgi:hypothetical protein
MRKITREIARAFHNREAKRIGNSRTDGNALYLHGNKIAEIFNDGELWITDAGWMTATTKERLNGLVDVHIRQSRGNWYLNGALWDGRWICVSGHGTNEVEVESEVEFDITSEWMGKYSKPIRAVYHTHDVSKLDAVEELLKSLEIPSRRMESDTQGEWKPNYFVVVMPEDVERAKRLTDEL